MNNTLKLFFRKTNYFWIITRVILIALFLSVIFNEGFKFDYSSIFVIVLFSIFTIILTYISIKEFLKKTPFLGFKILAGVFVISLALVIIFLIFYSTSIDLMNLFLLIFPLWLIIYGIWEIFTAKKNY